MGEMGLLSPPLAPSQDQLRKAHRRYRAGGIPGQPSGQSADRVASAPLCPRATPSVRWRYSGQVSIRDPLNDDRQPRTLPTSPVATLVALQGASGDIRARWGGRVLANFAPSAVGQAVQRLACGLDQELPFGAGDNMSTDDDLTGDVDLQLRRSSDFGAHRDHQPLVSVP